MSVWYKCHEYPPTAKEADAHGYVLIWHARSRCVITAHRECVRPGTWWMPMPEEPVEVDVPPIPLTGGRRLLKHMPEDE